LRRFHEGRKAACNYNFTQGAELLKPPLCLPPPHRAFSALHKQTREEDQPVFVHVIAIDIPPEIFASLKEAGATLMGASGEKHLQSQLDFILETQILVEAP